MKTKVIANALGLLMIALLTLVTTRQTLAAGPVMNSGQTFSVPENSPVGTQTSPSTVTAIDPEGGPLSFAIVGGTGASTFTIGPSTGIITVANNSALDYETLKSMTISVRVEDNEGLTNTQTFTVNLTPVSDVTPTMSNQTFSVAENSPNTTLVGTMVVTDGDEGETFTFSITGGSGASAFTIEASTGIIRVSNSAFLDYEVQPSFALNVRVTDSGGKTADAVATINLTNVNEAPRVTPGQVFSVDEDKPNGFVIGTVLATDPENNPLTYSIIGSSPIAINSTTGDLSVGDSSLIDNDLAPSLSVMVRVTDPGSLQGSGTVIVNVNPVNDAPVGTTIPDVLVNEGDPSPVISLFNFFSDDEDADSLLTLTVSNNSNPGLFSSTPINPTLGTLTLNFVPGASGSANITVRATDTSGKFGETTFKASVNSAPVGLPMPNLSIGEDSPQSTISLYEYFTDAEEADSALTYTIIGNTNGGIFSPQPSIVKPNLILNFAPNSFGISTLTIRATDSKGLSGQTTMKVIVNSVNDAPTTSGIANVTVNEDAPATVINLWTSFADVEDTDDELTYTVQSNSNTGLFDSVVIDPAAGTLTLTYKPNVSGVATIVIRARDTDNAFVDATFTVTILPQNDRPTVGNFSKQIVEEGLLTFTVSDFTNFFVDGDGDPLVEIQITELPDPTKGSMTIGGSPVVLNTPIAAATLNTLVFTPAKDWYEGSATFKWNGSDGKLYALSPATVTINVTAVNDAPLVSNFSKIGQENQPLPFSIEDFAARFFDVDGDALNKVRINTLPQNGMLKLNGVNIQANAQINRDNLGELTFVPTPGWAGETSFVWNGSDGTVYADVPATVTITINPVNDAPTVDLNGAAAGTNHTITYNTNAGPAAIMAETGTVTDADSETLMTATIIIVNRRDGTNEKLTANKTGTSITVSYNNASGIMTLQGPDTVENFQKILRTVKYENTSTTPNVSDRQISVRVNDGELTSPDATTTVKIVNPRISIAIDKPLQSVVSGGTAIFTISVTNVGDVTLNGITISSATVPDCNKTVSTLPPGQSITPYACLKTNVTANFVNTVTVTATEAQSSTTLTGTATGTVRIDNPNIQVNISPVGGDTLLKGQEARFMVTAINPSAVKLTDVVVTAETGSLPSPDPTGREQSAIIPSCGRNIGEMAAGAVVDYNCSIPNIQTPFQMTIAISGKLESNGSSVNDTDAAIIHVLNITVDAQADPFQISAGIPTKVRYNITLTNNSSKAVTLKQLTSINSQGQPLHGNLLDANNQVLLQNTCVAGGTAPTLQSNGGSFSCFYEVNVSALPPSFNNVIAASLEDDDGNPVTGERVAILTITDDAPLALTLSASPSSLIAPGGQLTLNILVRNNQPTSVQLTALSDALLGNLDGVGSCEVPQTIGANSSYGCSYSASIADQSAGSIIVFSASATVGGQALQDTAEVQITERETRRIHMPSVTSGAVAGEPNNSVCGSMAIIPENDYYFLPDDRNDWYYLNLSQPSKLTIRINNFVPEGQIVVFTGACTGPALLGNNGEKGYVPTRELSFGTQPAGRYYIWIISEERQSTTQQYKLRVDID